jgi:hypothetical protein
MVNHKLRKQDLSPALSFVPNTLAIKEVWSELPLFEEQTTRPTRVTGYTLTLKRTSYWPWKKRIYFIVCDINDSDHIRCVVSTSSSSAANINNVSQLGAACRALRAAGVTDDEVASIRLPLVRFLIGRSGAKMRLRGL